MCYRQYRTFLNNPQESFGKRQLGPEVLPCNGKARCGFTEEIARKLEVSGLRDELSST